MKQPCECCGTLTPVYQLQRTTIVTDDGFANHILACNGCTNNDDCINDIIDPNDPDEDREYCELTGKIFDKDDHELVEAKMLDEDGNDCGPVRINIDALREDPKYDISTSSSDLLVVTKI